MLRIIICDDDSTAVKRIVELSRQYFEGRSIRVQTKTFTSPEKLFEMDIDNVDILFLDVEMGDINGIDVAKRIRKTNKKINIIYISSYIDFAMSGYEIKAYNYLLKSDLDTTFNKCMDNLIQDLYLQKETLDFSINHVQHKVLLSEIVYIESNKRVLNLYLNNNNVYELKHIYYESMINVDDKLSSKGFLRIQNSYLVNMNYIQNIKGYNVTLKNGESLKATTRAYARVLSKWTTWLGDN